MSDAAPTCPGCGRPLAPAPLPRPPPMHHYDSGPVVTTKPTFWHSPNVGCAATAILVIGIAMWLVSRC